MMRASVLRQSSAVGARLPLLNSGEARSPSSAVDTASRRPPCSPWGPADRAWLHPGEDPEGRPAASAEGSHAALRRSLSRPVRPSLRLRAVGRGLMGVRPGADLPLGLLRTVPVQAHHGGIVLESAAGCAPYR